MIIYRRHRLRLLCRLHQAADATGPNEYPMVDMIGQGTTVHEDGQIMPGDKIKGTPLPRADAPAIRDAYHGRRVHLPPALNSADVGVNGVFMRGKTKKDVHSTVRDVRFLCFSRRWVLFDRAPSRFLPMPCLPQMYAFSLTVKRAFYLAANRCRSAATSSFT